MCQQFCETVSNYYPLILAGIYAFAVASIIFFVKGSDERQDAINEEEAIEPVQTSTPIEKIIRDSRYDVKKCSRCNKDVKRWGRWSLMFRTGKKKTVIGMLYTVLENNPETYKYKEIQ